MNQFLNIMSSVCIANKYTTWYINIIKNALARQTVVEYTEKHHILPKCFKLGGEKDLLNLVKLTGKEHFVCHMLLTKMVDDPALKLKLSCAAIRMSFSNGVDRYKLTATDYQLVKIQLSKNKKGSKGQTWSDEQRAKLKNRVPHNKGVPMTEEAKQNLRDKRKLQVTSPVSEETKQKIRSAFLGKLRPDHIKEKFVPNLRSHKGTKWWNNGVKNKRSATQPGPEWMLGKITPMG